MDTKTQRRPQFNSDKELEEFLTDNFTDTLKQSIRVTVRIMIKSEMEEFRKEVAEKLSFNGYYSRQMISGLGRINNIEVPRFRELAGQGLNLKTLGVFDQEKEKFLTMVGEMHRLGISQRKVGQLCERIFGIKISKNRVGLVHKELAQEESLQINNLGLADEFEYLLLDGIWVKCKNYGLTEDNKAVLLCALGITADGKRKIIGFQNALAEDFESWGNLLQNLKSRGLVGQNLKLVITDDNAALQKAVNQIYPDKPIQGCVTHKIRNVMGKTRHRNKNLVADDLKNIYQAETKDEATRRMENFAKKWFVAEEPAVRSLRFNFEKTLTYLDFPRELWHKIRTTNILEREFREVRRRIKVFDSSFNSPTSMINYGNTIFDNLNNHYPR